MRHAILYAIFLWLLPLACSVEQNYTIDDSFGDSLTKKMPIYKPDKWNNQTCGGCAIRPDPSKAYLNTYTAITYHPDQKNSSITMEFEGIAIYVFFILPNKQCSGITTYSAANFTIDGQLAGNFSHSPDFSTTDIFYNQTVFSKTNLPNGMHQLVVSATVTDMSVFINFDYAIYTKVTNETVTTNISSSARATASSGSTSSETPVSGSKSGRTSTAGVLGGTVGGVIGIGLVITLFLWYRSRKRNYRPNYNWSPPPPKVGMEHAPTRALRVSTDIPPKLPSK